MKAAHGTPVPQNSIVSMSARHETAAGAVAANAVATADIESAAMDASLVATADDESAAAMNASFE